MSAPFCAIRLDEVTTLARSLGASDVHLAPGTPPFLRVDGALMASNAAPLETDELAQLVAANFDARALQELQRFGDATATASVSAAGLVRMHAYRCMGNVRVALRLLPHDPPAMESLHLPRIVAELCHADRGLIVFAGPTGCGKTTSMAAMVDRMNRTQSRHIITIEDPVEYRYPAGRCVIDQREIGRDAESYESAVLGALRSDPDVLLIGELRSTATMRAALVAAETGHLVLATLHTADAPGTVARIVDAFEPHAQANIRAQLAQVLQAVICQRLFARVGGGRLCAAEVLLANDAVRNTIREGKYQLLYNVMQTHRATGMQTMRESLDLLRAQGDIDTEVSA